jgi:tRNA G46 methylase TrmB
VKVGIDVGLFLCDLAALHRDHFFVGIEFRPGPAGAARWRVRKRKLSNVMIICAEAEMFLKSWSAVGIVDVIHVYHPTPHPDRLGLPPQPLVNPQFVAECARLLRPWGTFRLITDSEPYFREAVHCFSFEQWWGVDWQFDELAQERGCFVGTPTEQDFKRKGPIFPAQFLRKG